MSDIKVGSLLLSNEELLAKVGSGEIGHDTYKAIIEAHNAEAEANAPVTGKASDGKNEKQNKSKLGASLASFAVDAAPEE